MGLNTIKVFLKSLPVLLVGLLGFLAYRAKGDQQKAREAKHKAQAKVEAMKATQTTERKIHSNQREARQESEKEHARQKQARRTGNRGEFFGDHRMRNRTSGRDNDA